jgi:hypothetical protein
VWTNVANEGYERHKMTNLPPGRPVKPTILEVYAFDDSRLPLKNLGREVGL